MMRTKWPKLGNYAETGGMGENTLHNVSKGAPLRSTFTIYPLIQLNW